MALSEEKNTKKVVVFFPEEKLEALKKEATEKNISVSALIRTITYEHINSKQFYIPVIEYWDMGDYPDAESSHTIKSINIYTLSPDNFSIKTFSNKSKGTHCYKILVKDDSKSHIFYHTFLTDDYITEEEAIEAIKKILELFN